MAERSAKRGWVVGNVLTPGRMAASYARPRWHRVTASTRKTIRTACGRVLLPAHSRRLPEPEGPSCRHCVHAALLAARVTGVLSVPRTAADIVHGRGR